MAKLKPSILNILKFCKPQVVSTTEDLQTVRASEHVNTSSQGTRTLKALTSPFLGFVINPK